MSPLHEVADYTTKLSNYKEIMKIESVMNSLAIDSSIYFVTEADRVKGIKKKDVYIPILGVGGIPFEVSVN